MERALEKAVSSFDRSKGVSVTLVDESLRLYDIRFHEKGRAFNLTLVNPPGGATVTTLVSAQQTTGSITQDADDQVTAQRIATELNKLKYASGNPLNVQVSAGPAAHTWSVAFDQPDTEADKVKLVGFAEGGGANKEIAFAEPQVITSLTVTKVDTRSTIFPEASLLVDLASEFVPASVEYNAVKFTNVDANSTIYGGGNTNTFTLGGDASFAGTLIGGTGLRPAEALLNADTILGAVGLQVPQLLVTNTLDVSGASLDAKLASPLTVGSLLTLPKSTIQVSTQTDGASGDAVQNLYLPQDVSGGSFKLTFGTETTSMAIAVVSGDPTATAANIKTQLESLSNIAADSIIVTPGIRDGAPYRIAFTGASGAQPLLVPSEMTLTRTVTALPVAAVRRRPARPTRRKFDTFM